MLAAGLMNGAAAAPEQHYLPFDGLVDYAYSDGGATGYSTQYALIVKISTLPTQTAASPFIAHLSDSAVVFVANLTDIDQMIDAATDTYRHAGYTLASGINYDRASTSQCAGAQVHMLGRNMTDNTARVRVIKASDQSVFWGPSDVSATQDRAPDDICLGALCNPNLTFNSKPCDIRLVAVVFVDAIPSDADLQLYAAPTCHDARPIFGASIKGYWAASSAVGSSIAALVGTAPITLSGPVAGELVAL